MTKVAQHGFTGGELSPHMYGRPDDAKYGYGVALAQNFIVRPQGPLRSRPGFEFITEVKDSSKKVRLLPFTFSTTQTAILEMGDKYVRFIINGSVLLQNGKPYEIVSPYAESELFDLHYEQSLDTFTFAHPSHPPMQLKRYGGYDWRFEELNLAERLRPPTNVSVSAYYPSDTKSEDKNKVECTYVVTALNDDGFESEKSSPATAKGNYYLTGGYMTISWGRVSGATHYRVYRKTGGIFGYIGETDELSIHDDNITAKTTTTPPLYDTSLSKRNSGIKSVTINNGGSGYQDSSSTSTFPSVLQLPKLPLFFCEKYSGRYNNYQRTPTFTLQLIDGDSNSVVHSINLTGHKLGTTVSQSIHGTSNNHTNYTYTEFEVYSLTTNINQVLSVNIPSVVASNPRVRIIVSVTNIQYCLLDDFWLDGLNSPRARSYSESYYSGSDSNPSYTEYYYTYSLSLPWRNFTPESNTLEQRNFVNYMLSFECSEAARRLINTFGIDLNDLLSYTGQDVDMGLVSSVTIKVTDSTGSGAVLVPEIHNGSIVNVVVQNAGTNYSDPVLTVVSNKGSGASLSAVLYSADDNDYPAAVGLFEQRRWFAGTKKRPLHLWATKSGTDAELSYHRPVVDDDRIVAQAMSSKANPIRHILALQDLILFTQSSELKVAADTGGAITPENISIKPQSYFGATNVQPIIATNQGIYCQARSGHLREIGYNRDVYGYLSNDLSLRAAHLFDGYEIVDLCYMKAPWPRIIAVSSNGMLLMCTYMPEQSLSGWSRHITWSGNQTKATDDLVAGAFESCATVEEGDASEEDVLYCVVKRTINGKTVRYIERMAAIEEYNPTKVIGLDSALQGHFDSPVNTLSGLSHLEGALVCASYDGKYIENLKVTNGSITLPEAAQNIVVGLKIDARIYTLPFVANTVAMGRGREKNIAKVYLMLRHQGSLSAGPTLKQLVPVKRSWFNKYTDEVTENNITEESVNVRGKWDENGQVVIVKNDDKPLELVSMSFDVEMA